MPTLDENIQAWNQLYAWQEQGDEWSRVWGGSSAQWYGTILPRLRSYVPADTILEIAPGFGRWTQFLTGLCSKLILVDISDKCISACKQRFAAHPSLEYHVNDGRSLDMVKDLSIELAFTFDSLVHAEVDVIAAYLSELARKLTTDGIAFIHHSNLGEYVDQGTGALMDGTPNPHWRALTVSAATVSQLCQQSGLSCVSQEVINWGGTELNDAITVATPRGSRWTNKSIVMRNGDFMREAAYIAKLAALYNGGSPTSPAGSQR